MSRDEAGVWCPIETAPKDGTLIDLLYPYPRCRFIDANWDEALKCWVRYTPTWAPGEIAPLPETEWRVEMLPNMQPTHWMSLPPPPGSPPSPSKEVGREELEAVICDVLDGFHDGRRERKSRDIAAAVLALLQPSGDRESAVISRNDAPSGAKSTEADDRATRRGAPLTVTITAPTEGNVSVHTRASGMTEAQVRPFLDRAISALQAERAELETCPYHARGEQP